MKILRTILFAINAMLALGLVLTTLAGVVAPSRLMLPSLLAFGYVPMLLANLAMILIWMLMGRWELLLSVAAIAARWVMVPLLLQAGGTSKVPSLEEHPYRLAVMTYNVHQFKGNGEDTVEADSIARRFVRLIRSEEPDVLCLQEYAAVRGVNVTDSLLTLGYNHWFGARVAKNGVPYGTVVFSKVPISYVKQLDPEKVMVELMHEGQRLRVVCVHMDSYRFDADDFGNFREKGEGKIKETILSHEQEWNRLLAPVINESTVPTILAGDLNDIPWSWLYHQLSRKMTDTFTECGNGFSATYRIGSDVMPAGPLAFRIDMVFRSEGLRTLSYKRIKTPLSDHYPVLVSVEFEI